LGKIGRIMGRSIGPGGFLDKKPLHV